MDFLSSGMELEDAFASASAAGPLSAAAAAAPELGAAAALAPADGDAGLDTIDDLFGEDEADRPLLLGSESQGGATAPAVISISDIFGDVSDAEDEGARGEDAAGAGAAEDRPSSSSSSSAAAAAGLLQPEDAYPSSSSSAAASAAAARDHANLPPGSLFLPVLPRPQPSSSAAGGVGGGRHIDILRLPKVVSVARRAAYDPATFDERAEDVALAGEGRIASREALLRFRFKRDEAGAVMLDPASGRPLRESNAQVVEWSDGSLTLHVGKEVFSVSSGAAEGDHSTLFAVARASSAPSVALPAPSARVPAPKAPRRETVMEAQGPVAHRLLLRALDCGASTAALANAAEAAAAAAEGGLGAGAAPGGLAGARGPRPAFASSSSALAAGGEAPPVAKRTKLAQIHIKEDPETFRQRRIRLEEDAARRLEGQRRKGEEALRASQQSGGSGGGSGRAGARGEEEEADGGEGDISLAAIKAQSKRGARGGKRGAAAGRGRAPKGRRGGKAAAEEEGGGEDSTSESGSDSSSSASSSSSGSG